MSLYNYYPYDNSLLRPLDYAGPYYQRANYINSLYSGVPSPGTEAALAVEGAALGYNPFLNRNPYPAELACIDNVGDTCTLAPYALAPPQIYYNGLTGTEIQPNVESYAPPFSQIPSYINGVYPYGYVL